MQELLSTDFSSFLDHAFRKDTLSFAHLKNIFSSFYKVLKNPGQLRSELLKGLIKKLWHCTGICEGKKFEEWIEKLIAKKTEKPNCTFKEFRELIPKKSFKHLHIFATRIRTEKIVHLSSEDTEWDDVTIASAIRASMSIPGVYIPAILKRKINDIVTEWKEKGSFLDGGMINNLPVETFDEKGYVEEGLSKEERRCPIFNKHTLGFSLISSQEKIPEPEEINNIFQLVKGFFSIYINAEELLRQLTPYNKHRIIEIDNNGVGLLEFNLSKEKQKLLIDSGTIAATDFVEEQGG
nr:hypothetical protein [Chlamydiota bacterium]